MERQNGFLIGLTGLAAGIAVGLLLAPKSGRDLRKDIRRTARH
ncbi:MAG: YtxH domain-containing protein, partial [Rhizobacter sp.]|nr:YtxH domain-containing protein [Chlorobiales bacterium]